MRNRFDRQLVQLNDELIEMGGMIEKAIADTVKALVNQDTELAKVVIDYDEEIDHQEREIEQLCLTAFTAAAGCKRFKTYILSTQDDHRYGENR